MRLIEPSYLIEEATPGMERLIERAAHAHAHVNGDPHCNCPECH